MYDNLANPGGGVNVMPHQANSVNNGFARTNGQQVNPAQQEFQDTLNQINNAMNNFSDEIPANDETVKEAKNTLSDLLDYIKSTNFKDWVNQTSATYKVPPKKVAENFITKILGIIGDILGITIATVGNVAHTLVTVVSSIIHGAINGVIAVANGVAGVVTLNQTNVI